MRRRRSRARNEGESEEDGCWGDEEEKEEEEEVEGRIWSSLREGNETRGQHEVKPKGAMEGKGQVRELGRAAEPKGLAFCRSFRNLSFSFFSGP